MTGAPMDGERWSRIEALYQAALNQSAADRGAFLERSCEGDLELRREVQRLLNQPSSCGPLDRPLWDAADLPSSLPKGARLGPYEILEQIGAGGMGVVYKARDTRLDRIVAVKVSNGFFSHRFEREARAVAALNHPHICTLHDVGPNYLVMEFIEGESLDSHLRNAPLSFEDALRYGTQIADALAAAHAAGIVHRDLKPANVMLSGATAKVLDFGLAKTQSGDSTQTVRGAMLGTLAYMAPEQLDDGVADYRSDIFSFGCVLYEMLTGRKAFDGKSHAALISAIMTSDPRPVSATQRLAPPALDRLVLKCLAKDPNLRWHSSRDLEAEIRWIATHPQRRTRSFPLLRVAAVAALLVFAAVIRWVLRTQEPATGPVVRFAVSLPPGTSFGSYDTAILSPDGSRMVFTATTSAGSALYLRSMDAVDFRPLYPEAAFPFWSPDGQEVAFFSAGKLLRLDLRDGTVVTLCHTPMGSGGTWSANGVILFANAATSGLVQVNSRGGTPKPVSTPDATRGERAYRWPFFLPDGKHFLFTVVSRQPDVAGIYIGSLDSRDSAQLAASASNGQYSSGLLLFMRGDAIVAQRFDAAHRRLSGDAFRVVEPAIAYGSNPGLTYSIVSGPGGLTGILGTTSGELRESLAVTSPLNRAKRASTGTGGASGVVSVRATSDVFPGEPFSAGGNVITFHAGRSNATRMVWFDRSGARAAYLGERDTYTNPALSPDGRTVAVCIEDPATGTRDIWLFDLASGKRTRFTFDPADDLNPVWSPDGRTIAFTSDRLQQRDLYIKPANGSSPETILFRSPLFKNSENWSPDGQYLIFCQRGENDWRNLFALPLAGNRQPIPLRTGRYVLDEGQVSPDGKWVAFRSEQSGVYEIYVQSFPEGKQALRVSGENGSDPQWSRDGRELYYIENESRLIAVPVQSSIGNLKTGTSRTVFEAPFHKLGRNRYVVAPNGRFLAIVRDATSTNEIALLVNWRPPER